MTAARALVVDDSRSARIALKRLLDKHRIEVDFAESGEEALDFLKHHLVDVIFMDHTMPGMDGLEAVAAIKGNPRTATIPVMMYTATEGEVYVGRARALGAIGVLSKQVQPGVLHDMLRKLGLLRDEMPSAETPVPSAVPAETPAAAPPPPEPPAPPLPSAVNPTGRALAYAADDDYDKQALGASVQALITSILNEQHMKLRSDILTSHREFARQVAAEILHKERNAAAPAAPPEVAAEADSEPAADADHPGRGFGLALLMLVPLLVLAALLWQISSERDAAVAETARLTADLELRDLTQQSASHERQAGRDAVQVQADQRYTEVLRGLEWALNQGGQVGFDEPPFSDRRAVELQNLLEFLASTGFRGSVRLESHLGEFCLIADASSNYRSVLPPPTAALDVCTLIGHPFDNSSFLGERQSVGFASFLRSSPLVNGRGINVEIVALDRAASEPAEPLPSRLVTAGEWNRVAARNHRVQYRIVPAE
ncbi:MAG: response regulator [Gammaproteobacteria bacterium]